MSMCTPYCNAYQIVIDEAISLSLRVGLPVLDLLVKKYGEFFPCSSAFVVVIRICLPKGLLLYETGALTTDLLLHRR